MRPASASLQPAPRAVPPGVSSRAGTLTRLRARRGSRPPAPRDRRCAWAYLFGAVCSARQVGAALVLPFANADALTLHLTEISTHVASGAHAVVVLDGAGWHKPGGRLRVPENVSLLRLPPYAPELNPVENVWRFLRQNQLSNRVLAGVEGRGNARGAGRAPPPPPPRLLLSLERAYGSAATHRLHHHPSLGIGQCVGPLGLF